MADRSEWRREQHFNGSEIFVVDDDETMRDTLSAVFAPEGCRVTCFAEGQSFLVAARARTPACILLDVNMPGRSGLDMLRELDAPHYPAPILIVSGAARRADRGQRHQGRRAGLHREADRGRGGGRPRARGDHGLDPPSGQRQRQCRRICSPRSRAPSLLTPREREVLGKVVAGASNKEAGRMLGISPRTVEVHRARIMDKLGARNTADLVRIVLGQGPRH